MSSWCHAPSANDFGSLMESLEISLLFVAFSVVVPEKGTNFWLSQSSGFGPEGPCPTPVFLLTQAIYAFKDRKQDVWDGFQPFSSTGARVVAPGAASIVARQQWLPPWHQVGLGLVGTMGLPSAVSWPPSSHPCGDKMSASDLRLWWAPCVPPWGEGAVAGPAAINQTWWGNLLCKGGQLCPAGFIFLLKLTIYQPSR